MIVYPAIDIRGGRCVQLVEGDFAREMAFDPDPADAARRWAAAGTGWVHVVDLDGAAAGSPANGEVVRRIRAALPAAVRIQLGGGLRDAAAVAAAFDLGIDRAVLGTAAIRSPELVAAMLAAWGDDRIAVGLDARDGLLAAGGWLEQTDVAAEALARELQAAGVRHLIFTDIRRDGTLVGPNLDALRALRGALSADSGTAAGAPAELIASGGVGKLADIPAIASTGAAGVIIGTALYDGRVDLAAALAAARNTAATV
jgi:phosphoribosylformimino-5-aminoimidazole carboxamide ribotide isomerase